MCSIEYEGGYIHQHPEEANIREKDADRDCSTLQRLKDKPRFEITLGWRRLPMLGRKIMVTEILSGPEF